MLNAINETHNLFHIAEPDVSRGVSSVRGGYVEVASVGKRASGDWLSLWTEGVE